MTKSTQEKSPHVALYRKYRPHTFGEVVGQEQALHILTQSIKQKKISHAYLFCGGRGTGKTTVARIVAREIGCNPEDVIEIDAASNRGIDEVRILREAVRTAPFSSPYKVYIIDEAHMLTKEAANALLKTLEEPPQHVVFILATTDPEKLPETIVSRCQKIVFKQPDVKTLSERLRDVAEREGRELGEVAAEGVARHGKGSYRDALGALEQLLAICPKVIKESDVATLFGTPDKEQLLKLLKAFGEKNSAEVMRVCKEGELSQKQALTFYDELIELFRTGLMLRVSGKDKGELSELVENFPTLFVSKHILFLLGKRELITISDAHAWTACTAICVSLTESA